VAGAVGALARIAEWRLHRRAESAGYFRFCVRTSLPDCSRADVVDQRVANCGRALPWSGHGGLPKVGLCSSGMTDEPSLYSDRCTAVAVRSTSILVLGMRRLHRDRCLVRVIPNPRGLTGRRSFHPIGAQRGSVSASSSSDVGVVVEIPSVLAPTGADELPGVPTAVAGTPAAAL
jgi:hypothetical protein